MSKSSFMRAPSSEDIGGRQVVVAYGDVAAEYEAMRTSAVVVDRSHRGRMRVSGDKAADVLAGLVTNDVLALHPGLGLYAAALTAKGKIIADPRIFAHEGFFLIDVPTRAWPGWTALIKKFVNPRIAAYGDESAAVRSLAVAGATAHHVVSALTGINSTAMAALPMYAHIESSLLVPNVSVARVPDAGAESFEVFVAAETYDEVWSHAVAAGATPAGLGAWEIARVEAGQPEWGIDIDEMTIPQEANFDELGAISYTKGCYVGQEVVARVHFRGHVNKHLRGLRAASIEPPPTGAKLFDEAGTEVGDVRSAVASPRLGGIALGMVRREIGAGSSLTARWDVGERRVEVTPLPFST